MRKQGIRQKAAQAHKEKFSTSHKVATNMRRAGPLKKMHTMLEDRQPKSLCSLRTFGQAQTRAAAAIARKAKLNHTDYSDLKTTPHLAPSHCFALFRYKKKEPSWGLYFCRWLYQYDSVHFCLSGIKSLTSPSMRTL